MAPEIYPEPQSGSSAVARERVVSTGAERTISTSADSDNSLSTLISGLVADAQELVRKEIGLAKAEVKEELGKAKDGAISLGIGIGVAAIGGVLLILMVVHALADLFDLRLWVSYLIVGGILAAVGAYLLLRGKNRLQEIDPMPRQTIESVQKDVEAIVPESLSSERK